MGSQSIPDSAYLPLTLEWIEWIHEYAKRNLRPLLIEERRSIPPSVVIDFGNKGLLGIAVEKEQGGLGLPYRDIFKITEELAGINTSLAIFVGLNNVLGVRTLARHASESMKQEALPSLIQGRTLASFALTEPSAGSNPRAMTTTAIPHRDGGWLLNGEKVWIGSAAWSSYIHVFANLINDQEQFVGMTGFVIRKDTPGFLIGEEALTMGVKGLVQNRLYLKDVWVSPEQLLGEEGAGFDVAQDTMKMGRMGLAAISLGAMKRCFKLVYPYVQHRRILTGLMLDNAVVLLELQDHLARIGILEKWLQIAVSQFDETRELSEETSLVCKILGPEFLWQNVDETMQMFGGRGYIETNYLPVILRDAKLLRIFEGPTHTLAFYLGILLLKKRGRQIQDPAFQEMWRELEGEMKKKGTSLDSLALRLGRFGSWLIVKSALKDILTESERAMIERALAKEREEALRPEPEAALVKEELDANYHRFLHKGDDFIQKISDVDFEIDPLMRRQE